MTPVVAEAASKQRVTSRWLIATGAVLVATLVGVNWTLSGHSELLRETVQKNVDNAGFNLFQFESHLLRLQDALQVARASAFSDPAELAELRLRYEVFVSRLEVLDTPSMLALLGRSPEFERVLAHSVALVATADPVLTEPPTELLTADHAAILLKRMSSLVRMVHDVTMMGVQVTAEQAGLRNAAVQQQNQLVLLLSVFQSLVTLAFAVLAMRQFRQQRARRRELEEAAVKLDAARLLAEAASRAKSDFLATMSHELRTPFNGMLGMLDLLADSPLAAEQQLQLRTASESAEHLLSILNDVLDASKLEAGQLSVAPQRHDLRALILSSVGLVASAAQAKGLQVAVDLQDDLPQYVGIDGQRFRQILLNLLTNAIKFSDHGPIEVKVRTSPAAATPLRRPGGAAKAVDAASVPGGRDEISVSVRDHGMGMDEQTMGRLFQRFSQGDASTSRRFGGTGLGLEISRSLARLMGGDIMVSSTAGQGSCFTLRVAAPPAPAGSSGGPGAVVEPDAVTAAQPARAVRPLDVLVAEDQAVNRLVIQQFLERLGHRPRFAEDGAQALQCVRERRPDLVLMDLHMPGMNGFEATRCLRADATLAPGLRIVALSADALAGSQLEARRCGMDDFLAKPVRRGDLERVLREAALALAEDDELADAGAAAAAVAPASVPAAVEGSLGWDEALDATLDRARIEELCETFGPERYLGLTAKFLADRSGTSGRLLAALQACDAAASLTHAHALKGAADNLGLRALADLARRIEHEARQVQALPALTPHQQAAQWQQVWRESHEAVGVLGQLTVSA